MSNKLRSIAAQAVALAPSNRAYGKGTAPFLGVDEGLNSKEIWDGVRVLVGPGLVSGAASLWYEIYRKPDGSIDPLLADVDYHQARRTQRANSTLKRQPPSDHDVASFIIANLHLYKHVIVLSADLGKQHDGLRTLLSQSVAPELAQTPQILGVTLVLKAGQTALHDYVNAVLGLFKAPDFRPGFKEIVV